ncbi:helix-turn-helix transcriptional regulator [Mycobacterium sp. pUA109]|uniref:helix-turn-helix transcriptional regulator n=1 Tax=Mycobacterium sp. pUA109 TaxID=3238982 RepID=UPI00351AF367
MSVKLTVREVGVATQGRGRPQRWPRNRQRERVLQLVREHDGAVDAAELADRMGLHITTVRFHLDALCEEGAVARTRIKPAGVGRPRTGYVAVQGRLDYRSFAEVLALELGATAEQRQRRAQRAGQRWAARILASEGAAPQRVPDIDERIAGTVQVFERMGFGPEATPGAGGEQLIRLHGCPVRDLARAHPEVTCGVHLGLLRGLLEGNPDTAVQADLEPFAEPELCIARVRADD